jgi:AraC-like DNA-binding protein
MKLSWNDQNALEPAARVSNFKRAAIGQTAEGPWQGALILLSSGSANCANNHAGPARNGVCLWLSREGDGSCDLSDDADGIVTMVRFPSGRNVPATSRILVATPLLYAVIERLAELEINSCPVRASYEDVAAEEILRDLDAAEAAQIPRSTQLQLWALRFIEDPRVTVSIEDAADAARMSVRSFTRHFKRETGEDFRTWKRRTLTNKAKAMLYVGRTVSEVSSELAYENVSSFIAMFKEATGKTPGDYTRDPKVWSDRASQAAVSQSRLEEVTAES